MIHGNHQDLGNKLGRPTLYARLSKDLSRPQKDLSRAQTSFVEQFRDESRRSLTQGQPNP